MRTSENAAIDDSLSLETLREVLGDHPVEIAILFGSHAHSEPHARNDIDIAVAFEAVRPSDSNYNEIFFELSAALSEALATDGVDLVDLRTPSPELVEGVFEQGVLLIGDPERATALRTNSQQIRPLTDHRENGSTRHWPESTSTSAAPP